MGLKDLLDPYASPHARQEGLVALLAIVGVVVVIAIVAVVILNPGGSSTPSTPSVVVPTETPFATLNPYATPVKTAAPSDTSAPSRVTDLTAAEIEDDSIKWTWSDPSDADLKYIMVYLDDVFKKNVTPGTEYYKASGLDGDTEYTISVRPIDTSGNLGSFRDNTASTGDTTDTNPPAQVMYLSATTGSSFILFTWNDPTDSDFEKVEVMVNDVIKGYVNESTEKYNVTGLSSGQQVIFKIRTVDSSGNKVAWSGAAVKTATTTSATATPTATATPAECSGDTTAPAPVTGLMDGNKATNYIQWVWTDPTTADFDHVEILFNGQTFTVNKDVQSWMSPTNLIAGTPYLVGVKTVDSCGNKGDYVTDEATTLT